jgi:fluoride ion exporter CrcB/FEX
MRNTMSSSRQYKAQIAFEYMFIFGIFMAAIIIGITFAWSKSLEVSNYRTRIEIDGLLITVTDKINTVWLEGEGFRTNITVPETVANQPYSLNVTSNYIIISVLEQDFTKPIITNNVTGSFTLGVVNTLTNRGDHIEISVQ